MKTQLLLLNNVSVKAGFWGPRVDMAREVILPFQWEVMNDHVPGASKSGVIQNFKIAAGKAKGEFHGYVFQDSDFGKWSALCIMGLSAGRQWMESISFIRIPWRHIQNQTGENRFRGNRISLWTSQKPDKPGSPCC